MLDKKIIKYVLMVLVVLISGIVYRCGYSNHSKKVESEGEITLMIDKSDTTETIEQKSICVYITGYVNCPGVYELSEGSRVKDVLVLAGGFSEDANIDSINLAREINDGEHIYVYGIDEETTPIFSGEEASDNSRVNINTASKDALMTLPGVGESRADAIITYRDNYGGFNTIEDIMNVPGIKEASFEKLKDMITVD